MGNSKKFFRNKQRASKSHKEKQHNKNEAAAATFVSQEKTNDDSEDLEAFVALMNSIVDTYGSSKCGGILHYPCFSFHIHINVNFYVCKDEVL